MAVIDIAPYINQTPGRELSPRPVVDLFGAAVDPLTMEQSVDRAEELITSGRRAHHVCINAAKVVAMRTDRYLRDVVDGADMVNVDGQSVVWAAKALGQPVPERVAGIDFMDALCERAAKRGWRVFFLGAREDVVTKAAARLEERYPGLIVAGCRSGFWKPHQEEAVVREIADAAADIVFVALPTPRKEYFVASHLEGLASGLVVGVGGSFDVVAGLVERAPAWMQRAGLEWMHRLLQEPGRMWKRYLVGNSKFLAIVARSWIRVQWAQAASKT